MKYKAVLFDMDGTVLDTLGDLAAAVNHTLREFSMPERSIAEVAAALGNGAAYLIAHTVPAGTPKELTDKVLAAYAPYYDAHCDILTGPYDGIVPLMQKLRERGVKLAVISNKQDTAVKPLARAPRCAASRTRTLCLQRCAISVSSARTRYTSAIPRSISRPRATPGWSAHQSTGASARANSSLR